MRRIRNLVRSFSLLISKDKRCQICICRPPDVLTAQKDFPKETDVYLAARYRCHGSLDTAESPSSSVMEPDIKKKKLGWEDGN